MPLISNFSRRTFLGTGIASAASITGMRPVMAQEAPSPEFGGPSISLFNEPGPGSVNSYLLEGDAGIVLIDAQRTFSAGDAVADRVEATGKPLLAMLLTHPHPDHIGGSVSILSRFPDTPLFATQEAADEVANDTLGMMAFAEQVNGDAFPKTLPKATDIFTDGDTLAFGDIKLVARHYGPGESLSMSLFHTPDRAHVFIGDIVDNDREGFLLEGRTAAWLDQLNDIIAEFGSDGAIAYPGHGDAAPLVTLAAHQATWIEFRRGLAAAALSGGDVSDAEMQGMLAAAEARDPDQLPVAPIPDLERLNLEALVEELRAEAN